MPVPVNCIIHLKHKVIKNSFFWQYPGFQFYNTFKQKSNNNFESVCKMLGQCCIIHLNISNNNACSQYY